MSCEKPFGMPNLPQGWSWNYFESLCEKVSVGHVGETSSFFTNKNQGIPFIRSQNVRAGKLDLNDVKYVSKGFHKQSSKSQLLAGDILIVRVGQNRGDCCVLPDDIGEINCANIVFGRLKNKKNAKYLGYFFNSRIGRESLLSVSTGSAQGVLNTKAIAKVIVPTPPEDIAEYIGSFLFDFEQKIHLNTQTNQTLEAMAQTLFRSWFVDFDPVKAKMRGEQPEGMDAATAALFPDRLVESELGMIPEGWKIQEIKQQIDVLRGFSYTGKGLVSSLEEGVSMHNLNSIEEGGGYKYSGLKFYSDDYKDKFSIKENDVLVANTEQGHNHWLIGYGAIVPQHLASGFFSHHLYRVRPKERSVLTPDYLAQLFCKGSFVRQVQGFTNGTTVNMLPVSGLQMPKLVIPPSNIIQIFDSLVKPNRLKVEKIQLENQTLANLRDTLLPKLLSGEIDLNKLNLDEVNV